MGQEVSTELADLMGEANASSPDRVQRMKDLAQQVSELDKSVAELEEAVKQQKATSRAIKEGELTDIMLELGMEKFEHADGTKFKLHNYVAGSLPKPGEGREAAIEYISEEGGEALIKNIITLEFEKSQHNEAMSLAAELRERGIFCDVEQSIHAATLQKFGREKIAEGDNFDFEKVGLTTGRVVKVTLP